MKLAVTRASGRGEAVLRFAFSAVTNAPIQDLQLYLGASGHMLVVARPDRLGACASGRENIRTGYQLWCRVPGSRLLQSLDSGPAGGRVITAPFVVSVQP